MIGGKLNRNRCGKDKGTVCSKECISECGIFHCDSDACVYCEAECGMRHNAQRFACELKEQADHLANKIDEKHRLYDAFCLAYRSFLLTVEFLKLSEPHENITTHSIYYKNYLQMYREGEKLRSVMEKIKKEEEK